MLPDSERTSLRRLSEGGRTVSELSGRYKLSRKMIHEWKKRYEQEGWTGQECTMERASLRAQAAAALGCQQIAGAVESKVAVKLRENYDPLGSKGS